MTANAVDLSYPLAFAAGLASFSLPACFRCFPCISDTWVHRSASTSGDRQQRRPSSDHAPPSPSPTV